MKTAAYIGKLTKAGVEPDIAQAHGEALEEALGENCVTKDYLDRKLAELETKMLRYMIIQTAGIGGIMFGLLRLVR